MHNVYPSKWLKNQSVLYIQCSILVCGWLSDKHKQTVMDFYCEPKQSSVVGYVAP